MMTAVIATAVVVALGAGGELVATRAVTTSWPLRRSPLDACWWLHGAPPPPVRSPLRLGRPGRDVSTLRRSLQLGRCW